MYVIDRRRLLSGALALGAAAGVAGRSARAAEGPLVIYNGQHRQLTEAIVAAFTKSTGIPVTVRQGESSALANQIMEEGARSPADIFYSEQSPPMVALDEKGLLAPTDPETLREIPAAYASSRGTWLGACMRSRVIVYHTGMAAAAELPASILEIATSAWKDRVGYVVRDGFQEQIMAIVKLKGQAAALDWLKGLKANGRLYNGNGAAMNAVEKGEIATALVNNYYWFGLARERGAANMKSALHYVAKGDPGALINLSPAAMLKSSGRAAMAQQFLAFLVGQDGQTVTVNTYAEYPVRPGIVSPFPLKPLDEIGAIVSPDDIGSAQLAYSLMRDAAIL